MFIIILCYAVLSILTLITSSSSQSQVMTSIVSSSAKHMIETYMSQGMGHQDYIIKDVLHIFSTKLCIASYVRSWIMIYNDNRRWYFKVTYYCKIVFSLNLGCSPKAISLIIMRFTNFDESHIQILYFHDFTTGNLSNKSNLKTWYPYDQEMKWNEIHILSPSPEVHTVEF